MSDFVTVADLLETRALDDLKYLEKHWQKRRDLSVQEEIAFTGVAFGIHWDRAPETHPGWIGVLSWGTSSKRFLRMREDFKEMGAVPAVKAWDAARKTANRSDAMIEVALKLNGIIGENPKMREKFVALNDETPNLGAEVRNAAWEYIAKNTESFRPLPAPKKGLFGRLFG